MNFQDITQIQWCFFDFAWQQIVLQSNFWIIGQSKNKKNHMVLLCQNVVQSISLLLSPRTWVDADRAHCSLRDRIGIIGIGVRQYYVYQYSTYTRISYFVSCRSASTYIYHCGTPFYTRTSWNDAINFALFRGGPRRTALNTVPGGAWPREGHAW